MIYNTVSSLNTDNFQKWQDIKSQMEEVPWAPSRISTKNLMLRKYRSKPDTIPNRKRKILKKPKVIKDI